MLSLIFVHGLVACMQATSGPPDEVEQVTVIMNAARNVPTLMATQIPDVVLNARQHNQIVALKLGQVLKVESPSLNVEWQVDFEPTLFESITPQEMARAPGAAGWLFRAIATGEGQIVLTSIVSCSDPPCPLMPMRFQLVVQVK